MKPNYNKLWKKLIDKRMSKTILRNKTDISSATLAKLSKNEVVSMDIIFRICDMIINQKLNLSDYVQTNLEDYFNYEFSRGITVLNMLKNLK